LFYYVILIFGYVYSSRQNAASSIIYIYTIGRRHGQRRSVGGTADDDNNNTLPVRYRPS